MIHRLFLLLAFTLFLKVSYAQNECPTDDFIPSQEQVLALQKTAKDRGFLWKISKNGKASHLFGTIHAAKFDWVFPGPKLIIAIKQSKKIAFELNLQDSDTMKELGELAASKNGPILSKELNERMQGYAVKNCINPELFKNYRPEFQMVMLETMSMKKDGIDPNFGIDSVLLGISERLNIKILGLETPKEQLDALISLPEDLEQDILESLTKLESEEDRITLKKLVTAWAESDFSAIDSYMQWCKCAETPKDRLAMKRMIDDRNVIMAKRIDAMHADDGKLFIAVGVLHMAGPMGLPSLLKALGYSVEKIY